MRRILLLLLLVPACVFSATYAPFVVSNSPILASFTSSRTSGAGPLSVVFDATTTSAPSITSAPFHELRYKWNFGDTNAGTWGDATTGAAGTGNASYASRNIAEGPIAAHVFDHCTSGTTCSYSVTLTVTDGTNSSNVTQTITVTDPNYAFAGANTYCIAAATLPVAGADGCPAGATAVQQADWPTIIQTYASAGHRILLKHDDTFTMAATGNNATAVGNGPGSIGMYGTGAKPIITWNGALTGAYTLVQLGSTNGHGYSDWSFVDLDFEGGGTNTQISALNWAGDLSHVTVLRNVCNNIYYCLNPDANIADFQNYYLGTLSHHTMKYIVYQDSTATNINKRVIFAETAYMGVLGNSADNVYTVGEHVMRIQHCNRCAISHNTMRRPGSMSGTAPKEILTLRAQPHGQVNQYNPAMASVLTIDGIQDSQYNVISDNQLIGGENSSVFILSLVPQQAIDDARVIDVLVERNWLHYAGTTTGAAGINARPYSDATIRNNVIDVSLTGNASLGIALSYYDNYSYPHRVNIYNNTIYNSGTQTNYLPLDVTVSGTKVTYNKISNNLIWTPNIHLGGNNKGVSCNGSSNLTNCTNANNEFHNNTLYTQVDAATGPFVSATPSVPTDFQPCSPNSATCYATGGGTSVPVLSDYFGAARTGTLDMGAVNH